MLIADWLTKAVVVLGSVALVAIAGAVVMIVFVRFMGVLFEIGDWLIGKVRRMVRA